MAPINNQNESLKLVSKRIVMAKDIGIHGNLFGGILMAWIDEVVAAYATEYCHLAAASLASLSSGTLFLRL